VNILGNGAPTIAGGTDFVSKAHHIHQCTAVPVPCLPEPGISQSSGAVYSKDFKQSNNKRSSRCMDQGGQRLSHDSVHVLTVCAVLTTCSPDLFGWLPAQHKQPWLRSLPRAQASPRPVNERKPWHDVDSRTLISSGAQPTAMT